VGSSMKNFFLIIISIMSIPCWGMMVGPIKNKTPKKTGSHTVYSYDAHLIKRSFSSSKPITHSMISFPKDPVVSLFNSIKLRPSKKGNPLWSNLAKMCATSDTKELVVRFSTLYMLDIYPYKHTIDNAYKKEWDLLERHIAQQNNEYIHALAAPGSDLFLRFNSSNLLR